MATVYAPSPDTRAILILCARLGRAGQDAARPLTPSEYDGFARWLRRQGMQPADVRAAGPRGIEGATPPPPVPPARLCALLDREAALDRALETWASAGLWVVSRADGAYPRRLVAELGRLAPPILYGAGATALLSGGGLAVVGSRHADVVALDYARRVAAACARHEIQVVSGGARGVDSAAMEAALEEGGTAVGVLADSLARQATSRAYRRALLDGRLALLSACDPAAGFDVGNAMGRNKYVYALADAGLVVSASLGTGGTWAGAVETLARGRPLFVRVQGEPPEANLELVAMGARPFPDEPWTNLAALVSGAGTPTTAAAATDERAGWPARTLREPAPLSPAIAVAASDVGNDGPPAAGQRPTVPAASLTVGTGQRQDGPRSIYEAVLPLLLVHLAEPRDADDLAQALDVQKGQLQRWLTRALKEGTVAAARENGVARYVAW